MPYSYKYQQDRSFKLASGSLASRVNMLLREGEDEPMADADSRSFGSFSSLYIPTLVATTSLEAIFSIID